MYCVNLNSALKLKPKIIDTFLVLVCILKIWLPYISAYKATVR